MTGKTTRSIKLLVIAGLACPCALMIVWMIQGGQSNGIASGPTMPPAVPNSEERPAAHKAEQQLLKKPLKEIADPAPATVRSAASHLPAGAAGRPSNTSPSESSVPASDKDETDQMTATKSPSSPRQVPAQMIGTRRMIAAHAPLRIPAIADPDSVENKRILQAMIFKALGRSDESRGHLIGAPE